MTNIAVKLITAFGLVLTTYRTARAINRCPPEAVSAQQVNFMKYWVMFGLLSVFKDVIPFYGAELRALAALTPLLPREGEDFNRFGFSTVVQPLMKRADPVLRRWVVRTASFMSLASRKAALEVMKYALPHAPTTSIQAAEATLAECLSAVEKLRRQRETERLQRGFPKGPTATLATPATPATIQENELKSTTDDSSDRSPSPASYLDSDEEWSQARDTLDDDGFADALDPSSALSPFSKKARERRSLGVVRRPLPKGPGGPV